jgi:hypothetical protein
MLVTLQRAVIEYALWYTAENNTSEIIWDGCRLEAEMRY